MCEPLEERKLLSAVPVIGSLSDSPDPVTHGENLTLTAGGVTDSDGTVDRVDFYRDVNGNGSIDEGTDVLLGTDTSDTGGWTWTGPASEIPAGVHTYMAQARDTTGDVSNTVSVSGTVNQPPVVGSLSDSPDPVTPGDDLTLTATGVTDDEAVVKVEFYRDVDKSGSIEGATDELLGTDSSSIGGWTWTGSTAGFPLEVNTYLARAQDDDGAWSNTVSTTGAVTSSPTIGSVSDSPDPIFQGEDLTLTANDVADSDGTIAKVEFYRDVNGNGVIDAGTDMFLGADTSDSGGWTGTGSTSGFPAGTNTYMARAQDNNGAWSATVKTTGVIHQPPTIGSLSASPNPVTPGSDFTLTADDVTDGDAAVVKVEFYRDEDADGVIDVAGATPDTLLGTDADGSDGWTWTGATNDSLIGTHKYLARAQDEAGAWGNTVSTTGTVSRPPIIVSLSDSPDPVAQGGNLSLTANGVADSDGTVLKVEFYRDINGNETIEAGTDKLLGTDTSDSGGWTWTGAATWTGSASSDPVGSCTYMARAQDDAGAWSNTAIATGKVNQPPTIASLSDSPDSVPRGTNLTLTANSVADGDGTVVKVDFYRDVNANGVIDVDTDTLLGTDTSSTGGWTCTASTSGFPDGTNTYLARAQDNDDLWSDTATTTGTILNRRPLIKKLIADSNEVVQGHSLTLTAWSVSDKDGTVIQVEFYHDKNMNGKIDAGERLGADGGSFGGWTWTVPTKDLQEGTYTFMARAQDDDGAWSWSKAITITVSPPQAPTIGSLEISPDPVDRGDDLTLTAKNVKDPDSTDPDNSNGEVVRVEFFRDVNGNGAIDETMDEFLGVGTSNETGDEWTCTGWTGAFLPGANTYMARAQDNDGLWGKQVSANGTVNRVTMTVMGTSGVDTFEFTAGATPDAWIVKLNGELLDVPRYATDVTFDGLGGQDQAILTGTNAAEIVDLTPGHGTMEGINYVVDVSNVESIRVDGALGRDIANFYDSRGDDLYTASPTKASMSGSGYYNEVNGFRYKYGYSRAGGIDKAYLYDSAGDDTFKATSTCATLSGTGFYERAKYFDYVYAYGSDGYDQATLNDSSSNDSLEAEGNWAQLSNAQLSYLYRVSGFNKVTAVSQNAGDTKHVVDPLDFLLIANGMWEDI